MSTGTETPDADPIAVVKACIQGLSRAGKLRFAADLLEAEVPRPELAQALANRVAIELGAELALQALARRAPTEKTG